MGSSTKARAMSEILYFGCVGRSGHYVYEPCSTFRSRNIGESAEWLRSMDGELPPKTTSLEGAATITHRHNSTVISFWDRSVDTRPGSSSTFLIPGLMDFDTAKGVAKATFPEIWKRYKFEVYFFGDALLDEEPVTPNVWQPIDTAPSDTQVVLWWPKKRLAMSGWYVLGETLEGHVITPNPWHWYPDCDYNVIGEDDEPSHWMPMPKPPEVPNDQVD